VTSDANAAALEALAQLDPEPQLDAALDRLCGHRRGPLAAFELGGEPEPAPDRIDGRLLEAIAARALGGARGAVFTPVTEARLLAAFGLAHAAARRGGPPPADAVEALLAGRPDPALAAALDGLAVLDPACGGGALLAAAARLAAGVGARLDLHGLELSPLGARATRERLDRRRRCRPWRRRDRSGTSSCCERRSRRRTRSASSGAAT